MTVRNCMGDEGRPFEVGNQVLISSHFDAELQKYTPAPDLIPGTWYEYTTDKELPISTKDWRTTSAIANPIIVRIITYAVAAPIDRDGRWSLIQNEKIGFVS